MCACKWWFITGGLAVSMLLGGGLIRIPRCELVDGCLSPPHPRSQEQSWGLAVSWRQTGDLQHSNEKQRQRLEHPIKKKQNKIPKKCIKNYEWTTLHPVILYSLFINELINNYGLKTIFHFIAWKMQQIAVITQFLKVLQWVVMMKHGIQLAVSECWL